MNQLKNYKQTGAAYIRVSTEEQTELSPDAQKRLILDYAEKNGVFISEDYIFTENGISGKHAKKRPEFQRMIGLAKSKIHPFDVILVWKFSRFARNQEESIVYKSMLKKDRVDVVSVSEPLVDGPFGTLIERIIEWMDEYYSIRLSGEVRRGMTEKALRGGYQSALPLGYRTAGSGNPPLVLESEAALVQLIFTCYLQGMDLSGIAGKLNKMGCTTRRGGHFESRSIRYILTNPFYVGKVRWNPSGGKEGKADDIIIVDGSHIPLITEVEFYEVQEKLKRTQRQNHPIRRPLSENSHWLSGLLSCPICGSGLSYNRAQTKYGSFQCWQYAKGRHPGSASISAKKASEAVLLSLSEMEACHADIYRLPIASQKEGTDLVKISFIEKELRRIEEKEKKARNAYESGIDSLEEYAVHKARLGEQKNLLQKDLNALHKLLAPISKNRHSSLKMCSVCDFMSDLQADSALKNTALRSVLKRIVYEKESGVFHFYYHL